MNDESYSENISENSVALVTKSCIVSWARVRDFPDSPGVISWWFRIGV